MFVGVVGLKNMNGGTFVCFFFYRLCFLSHSNADAERVFSTAGLNKTKTRNTLALDGTLSSIMTVKMADIEPQYYTIQYTDK